MRQKTLLEGRREGTPWGPQWRPRINFKQFRHSIRPHCVWPDFVTTGTPPFKNTQSAGYLWSRLPHILSILSCVRSSLNDVGLSRALTRRSGNGREENSFRSVGKEHVGFPGCGAGIVRLKDLIVAGTRCQYVKCQLRTDPLLGMGGGLVIAQARVLVGSPSWPSNGVQPTRVPLARHAPSSSERAGCFRSSIAEGYPAGRFKLHELVPEEYAIHLISDAAPF